MKMVQNPAPSPRHVHRRRAPGKAAPGATAPGGRGTGRSRSVPDGTAAPGLEVTEPWPKRPELSGPRVIRAGKTTLGSPRVRAAPGGSGPQSPPGRSPSEAPGRASDGSLLSFLREDGVDPLLPLPSPTSDTAVSEWSCLPPTHQEGDRLQTHSSHKAESQLQRPATAPSTPAL